MSTSIPQSYKAFRRTANGSTIEMVTETTPTPATLAPTQLLLRIHAISLNYRDIAMTKGTYPVPVLPLGIPASDCAAEVIAVGSDVRIFSPGHRVAPVVNLECITGTEDAVQALGGDVDGVLREYAVFEERVLVRLPGYLSWEEAACITCAGPTAWLALGMPRSSGTALLQGTGGVSMFALLLSLAAGIHPIITSSSDKKLQIAQALGAPGAVGTVNYKTHPNWDEAAREMTGGRGVDVVVDNVGPSAIQQSLASLARRGLVSLVGFLGGFEMDRQPDVLGPVLLKSAVLRGINPGSKADLQDLCRFIEDKETDLGPIVDSTVFSFEDSRAAFEYLYAGRHVGKVVIRI